MNKQNYNLDEEIERKFQRRDKKKKPKMKFSGGSVKKLQKIIINKNK